MSFASTALDFVPFDTTPPPPDPRLVQREPIAVTRVTGDPLDGLIFGDSHTSPFALSLREQGELRRRCIHAAAAHHLQHCASYRSYAEHSGYRLPEVEDFEIEALPPIPTSAFKRAEILSVPPSQVEKVCKSSGTRGPQSRVLRDRRSLERLLGSVTIGIPLIEDWYENEFRLLNLGPDRAAAGDIWFSYVMSLMGLLYPSVCAVRDEVFDKPWAYEQLVQSLDDYPNAGIVGPPFLLLGLIEYMESQRLRLAAKERLTIVTAGGWKAFSGSQISRQELLERAAATFGIQHEHQLRDAFNQVELNTVFMECKALRKHIPPWVHTRALDARSLQPLPLGEVGLLAHWDASATSYPSFILTDDIGRVQEGLCACGREGQSVEVRRRVEGRIQRGCSQSMARRFTQPPPQASSPVARPTQEGQS